MFNIVLRIMSKEYKYEIDFVMRYHVQRVRIHRNLECVFEFTCF